MQQLQGVMLVSVSAVDIAETLAEMEQRGVMLIGSIVVLSVFLAWLLYNTCKTTCKSDEGH